MNTDPQVIKVTGVVTKEGELCLHQALDLPATQVEVIIIPQADKDIDNDPTPVVLNSLGRAVQQSIAEDRIPLPQLWQELDAAWDEMETPLPRPLPYEEAQTHAEELSTALVVAMLDRLRQHPAAKRLGFTENDVKTIQRDLQGQLRAIALGTLMGSRLPERNEANQLPG